MSAALECPRGKRRSSKHWLVMQGWQGAEAKVASMPRGNGAKSLRARQQRPRSGQRYRQGDVAPKIGSHRLGALENGQKVICQNHVIELSQKCLSGIIRT